MYKELRKEAVDNLKKLKKKERSVQVVAVTFTSISIVLFVLSMTFPSASFGLRFPILLLALVYGIVHVSALGMPFSEDSDGLSQEEIEREMVKIYRLKGIPSEISDDDEVDALDLRELESMRRRLDQDEEFV